MNMQFSDIEKTDLIKGWAAVTLAFAIFMGALRQGDPSLFIIAGVAVGLGFIVHELAHKYMAQMYGMWAEFRADDTMLGLAIVLAIINSPILFIAPGAVMIAGPATLEESGKISIAGPITNIIIAIVFYLLILAMPAGFGPNWIGQLLFYGFKINAWLALFNMIPFGPLDGSKVLRWSQANWAIVTFVSFYLAFVL